MNAGEFANLQCIAPTGDLPLNIRWSYPGEEMGGSSGVLAKKVADRVSMLMISVITARHAGEYVCTAENAAGTASHSTTLTVNGSGLSSVPTQFYTLSFFFFTIYSLSFRFVSVSFMHNPGKQHRREYKASFDIPNGPCIENPTTSYTLTITWFPYDRIFNECTQRERVICNACDDFSRPAASTDHFQCRGGQLG